MRNPQRIRESTYRKACGQLIDQKNQELQAEFVAAYLDAPGSIRKYIGGMPKSLIGTDEIPLLPKPVARTDIKAGDKATAELIHQTYGELPAGLAVNGGLWAHITLANIEAGIITLADAIPEEIVDMVEGKIESGTTNSKLRRILYELGGIFKVQGWSSLKWGTLLGASYWRERWLDIAKRTLELTDEETQQCRRILCIRRAWDPTVSMISMRPNIASGPIGQAATIKSLTEWMQEQTPIPNTPVTLNKLRTLSRHMARFEIEAMSSRECLAEMRVGLGLNSCNNSAGDEAKKRTSKPTNEPDENDIVVL